MSLFGTVKPDVSVKVMIGKPGETPEILPATLNLALRKVGVTVNYEAPSAFDLQFEAERYDDSNSGDEFPILATGLLQAFSRVQIVATVDETEKVLMDGYITQLDVSMSANFQNTISVKGEDISLKMDLFDVYAEFPTGQKPTDIVTTVLGNYQTLSITSDVNAPSGGEVETNKPTQQRETDRKFVMGLAHENDCIFYIEHGSSVGDNKAYWGPRKEATVTQKSLAINLGPGDNLESLSMAYNGLAATMTFGKYLDRTQSEAVQSMGAGSVVDDPTSSFYSTSAIPSSLSSLAESPDQYVQKLSDLNVRGTLYEKGKTVGTNLPKAKDLVQAATDRSVEKVVSGSGSLDTAKYGGFLEIRGKVDVRGAGDLFDGTYLVQQVTHNINLDPTKSSYTQSFSLVRGGTGAT